MTVSLDYFSISVAVIGILTVIWLAIVIAYAYEFMNLRVPSTAFSAGIFWVSIIFLVTLVILSAYAIYRAWTRYEVTAKIEMVPVVTQPVYQAAPPPLMYY